MAHYKFPIVVCGAMACAFPVQGHHAAGAAFTNEEIQIEGIVSEFNFTNPHVNMILSVTNDGGAETLWMATAPAPVSLRRTGWSADSIEEGQKLRLTGYRSRDGRPMILVENEHWDGGGIVELDPADGSIVRTITATPSEVQPVPAGPSLRLGDGRPNLAGSWNRRASVRARDATTGNRNPPFNEYGASVQAAFDPVTDPTFTECADYGLIRLAIAPQGMQVTQYEDRVVIVYEWGADRRVLYLDGRRPETDGKTRLGYSVARYEDDALVVETTRILGDLTGTAGNAVGDGHTIVETYRRVEDEFGAALQMTMVITDPEYLIGPWEISWKKHYAPGYVFTEYDCRLPFLTD